MRYFIGPILSDGRNGYKIKWVGLGLKEAIMPALPFTNSPREIIIMVKGLSCTYKVYSVLTHNTGAALYY